ncbi:MAG: four helix bundle protein [Nitrospirota bacterium]
MEKAKTFRDLLVWQKAHALALDVYKMTQDYPKEEKFGLVSQMRRSAVSIAANISEGFTKKGHRDKMNFYNIAQGSLEELKYYLILSHDLGYLDLLKNLFEKAEEVGRLLSRLHTSLENKQ